MTKMRLMSLVGLATAGSGEVSYAVIRDTLKVYCRSLIKALISFSHSTRYS